MSLSSLASLDPAYRQRKRHAYRHYDGQDRAACGIGDLAYRYPAERVSQTERAHAQKRLMLGEPGGQQPQRRMVVALIKRRVLLEDAYHYQKRRIKYWQPQDDQRRGQGDISFHWSITYGERDSR